MVIQRLQSLYLFIGVVLMVVFLFMPMATVEGVEKAIYPTDFPVYMILNILIAVLMFISIFMYRTLQRQKSAVTVCIVLILASIATGLLLMFGPMAPEGAVQIEWLGGMLLLLAALLLGFGARRGISRDIRTLSSYDRIR